MQTTHYVLTIFTETSPASRPQDQINYIENIYFYYFVSILHFVI